MSDIQPEMMRAALALALAGSARPVKIIKACSVYGAFGQYTEFYLDRAALSRAAPRLEEWRRI